MRLALEFVRSFVGSAHVDTRKIIDVQSEGNDYVIPLHEFMRAITYGDNMYYDSRSSPLVNLFDISIPDGREHFLLLILLAHVDRAGRGIGDEGFVPSNIIYEVAQKLAFTHNQVDFALSRGIEKRLVEVNPRLNTEAQPRYCRITTVGAYATRKLPTLFQYLDAVIVDTPIIEEEARGKIRDCKTIFERLDRAEIFTAYLDRQWAPLEGKGLAFDWQVLSKDAKEHFMRIRLSPRVQQSR